MKSFTLVEIVITIALVGIVLSMVTGMGRWFSDRVRFSNTKEELTSTITNVIQEVATTSSVSVGTGTQRYDALELSIMSWEIIAWSYSGAELSAEIQKEKRVSWGYIFTSGFKLLLEPYQIKCDADASPEFSVISADNVNLKACYQIATATCKLKEIHCQ